MMSNHKTESGSTTEKQKHDESKRGPTSFNMWFGIKLVAVPQILPMASDYVGSIATVATGQISRSNHAISYVAAFGQILTISPFCQETSISGRRRGRPSPYRSIVGLYLERVLSVDSFYGTPIQIVGPKNVFDDKPRFRDFDAWIPEKQPGEKPQPSEWPNLKKQNGHRFAQQRNSADGGKGKSQRGYEFARTRAKYLGVHYNSFTQIPSWLEVVQ